MVNGKKLSEEELEQINGGFLVKRGDLYYLVGNDGSVPGYCKSDLEYMIFTADLCDVSHEVISVEEYERRFNRKFVF